MQVTQEKRPGSRIGFSFVIPADQVKRSYDKTVRGITQQAEIQGFRKGKAPLSLILRTFGKERLRASALEELLESSVKKAIKDAKVEPLTPFDLDGGMDTLIETYDPDAELSFAGSVEVLPEMELGTYTGLSVQAVREEPDPSEVDATLLRWQKERATLIPVDDRPAQLGDLAIVDFTATQPDGSPLEGSTAHDFELDLEVGNFYPGLVEGVVGMAIDEIKDIPVTLPDDYFDEALAGQEVKFNVTLNDLKTKELPELDDAFVQSLSRFTSVEELRDFLVSRGQTTAIRRSESNAENALLEALIKDVEIDLPASMVEQEVVSMVTSSLSYLQESQGFSAEDLMAATKQNWPELSEKVRPEAIERLRRSLAIAQIITRENIEVGQTELEVALDEYMQNYQGDTQKLNIKETAQGIYRTLMTQKAIRWLVAQSHITWVDAEGNPVAAPQLDPSPETTPETTFVEEGLIEAVFENQVSEETTLDVAAETVTQES